jgi:hypothetical protein
MLPSPLTRAISMPAMAQSEPAREHRGNVRVRTDGDVAVSLGGPGHKLADHRAQSAPQTRTLSGMPRIQHAALRFGRHARRRSWI